MSARSGVAPAPSQPPTASAIWFNAARSVSTTNSSRFRSLVAPASRSTASNTGHPTRAVFSGISANSTPTQRHERAPEDDDGLRNPHGIAQVVVMQAPDLPTAS